MCEYKIIYVVPPGCRVGCDPNHWKCIHYNTLITLFPILENKSLEHLEFFLFEHIYLTWSCAGCTVNNKDNACPNRRCNLHL